MADGQRRLILGNGEHYVLPVVKTPHGRGPLLPRTYDEARAVVRDGIDLSLQTWSGTPPQKKLPNEAVLCFRVHPDLTAKSYDPEALFDAAPELRTVGSRYYRESIGDVASTARLEKLKKGTANNKPIETIQGRLLFVQSSPAGFESLNRQLNAAESALTGRFKDAIRLIERVDVLRRDEQIMGFEEGWKGGRVELVFHPTRISADRQLRFIFDLFDDVGIPKESSRPSIYPGGPAFVSCFITRENLEMLSDVNPLRAAHPLRFAGLTDLRQEPTAVGPKPPTSSTRSTIKVGVFDGGIDPVSPLLLGHVEEDRTLEIKTVRAGADVAHGTAVAGAALYGPLNGALAKNHLSAPPVSVVSIRVFPVSAGSGQNTEEDLYEAIDIIQDAVPKRPDIKIFNISWGPSGPILDDPVSRFTYTLDLLSYQHKVAFFVAVGNQGESLRNRIQAPSDIVHGIGVGAFTLIDGVEQAAPYSCRGPGRECGKIKPDISAFGGCKTTPIHLVSTNLGKRVLSSGTSFASPIAASLAAQAVHGFDRGSALLARALLIHKATHPNGVPDEHLGHGCLPVSAGDLFVCDDDTVTIVFQGAILPATRVRLPIPLPNTPSITGKIEVTWTVAGLPPIDPTHAGDYTSACLEDTYYPHSSVYTFTPPEAAVNVSPKRLNTTTFAADVANLLAIGWKQSEFPVSASGNKYRGEQERRAIDCKWEPIVRRHSSKLATGVSEPFLVLHAIGRNGATESFDYAAIVTVRAKQFSGDLYTAVRTQYPALAPIRLRTEAEIRVAI